MGNAVPTVKINQDDFVSPEIHVGFVNNSTGTSVKDGRMKIGHKTQKLPEEASSISFVEFLDHGMVLQVPKRTCSSGHNLTIDVQTKNTKKELSLVVSAKVSETESVDKTFDRVCLKLIQFDEAQWEEFCKLYDNHQENLMTMFKQVRGY